MTTALTPGPRRRPLRVLVAIVWALVALASGVAILLGALTAALNGAGFETTLANSTPLFVACLVVNLAAGVCGILLGGRWWTAPLVTGRAARSASPVRPPRPRREAAPAGRGRP